MKVILEKEKCPEWVKYPASYLTLIQKEKDIFLPWYLTDKEDAVWRCEGLKKRYPKRKLFSFARLDCDDDIACWEEGFGEKVIVMHDFTSPGMEDRRVFENFDTWYQWALKQGYDDGDGREGWYDISEIKIIDDSDSSWVKG